MCHELKDGVSKEFGVLGVVALRDSQEFLLREAHFTLTKITRATF